MAWSLGSLAACGSDAPAPRMLVDHARWSAVAPPDDPFDDRPAEVSCQEGGYGAEDFEGEASFSVLTGLCGYLTATQPALVSAAAGDSINVRLWHFDLTSPNPGEAHAAIVLEDTVIWEERVAIPSKGAMLEASVELAVPVPADRPVYFHLHNHGANSWSLIELSVSTR